MNRLLGVLLAGLLTFIQPALAQINNPGSGGIPGGTSGQVQYNNAGAFGGFTLGGDCTLSQPNITCSKTGGVAFAPIATSGSASDLSAGTVAAARMPALTGDVTSSAGSVATTLANTAVTPGSYTSTNITVDAKGRVTAAANGSGGGGGTPGGTSGQTQYNNAGAFGGYTPSGDITVVASTGVETIAANAVTYAKFQQNVANSLVGNPTGSTANNQAVTLAGGLCFTSTTIGPCSPDRNGTNVHVVAGDMAGQVNITTGVIIDAISSTVFAANMSALITAPAGAITITSTPTINGMTNSGATLGQYGFMGCTSNGTSLDCFGSPGFGTITNNAIEKFGAADGRSTASSITDNGTTVTTTENLTVSGGTEILGANSGAVGILTINGNTSGSASLSVAAAAGAAHTMLLPTAKGTNGQALITDGGTPEQLSWSTVSGSGCVPAGSANHALVDSGSGSCNTITNAVYSGTGGAFLTLGSSSQGGEVVINNGAAGGSSVVYMPSGASAVNFGLPPTNGTSGNIMVNCAGSSGAACWNTTANVVSGVLTLGVTNTTLGSIVLDGNTSGAVTIKPQAAAGTWEFDLPIAPGSAGQVLTSQGGAGTAMTWTTPGTVTSITPGAGVASTNVGGTSAITTIGTLFADASYFPFFLGGLTLSNDGITPNTIIDIAAGAAASDDSTAMMKLAAFTKTTGAWSLGTAGGCLDTGSVAASTWYHVFVIERTDTSVVDALCSTSASSPTFPTSYTKKRRIGSFKTNGSSNIIAFTQRGNVFWWKAAVLDVNVSTLSTSQVLETLSSVPTGVVVQPICRYTVGGTGNAVILLSPDVTDVAPTATTPFSAAPGFDQLDNSLSAGDQNTACPTLTTNTSGQVGARATAASTTLAIVTSGWVD